MYTSFYEIDSHQIVLKAMKLMETRYKLIANNVVFLIFAFVGTTNCASLNLTDANVCPRRVTVGQSVNQTQWIIECCPDFVKQNGKCQACPAGKFGKDCLQPCMPNYYGVQCKQTCNCTINKKCDPVRGCICDTGFTGSECLNACPPGTYGVNCNEECFCANDAECDPVTGICLCSAGWFGDQCTHECPSGKYGVKCKDECFCAHDANCNPVTGDCLCPAGIFGPFCTKDCPNGTFGRNCSGICACSNIEHCDAVTGECIQCNPESDKIECNSYKDEIYNLDSGQNSNKSNDNVIVYISMVAAIIGIVCVVTMVVKVKERLCLHLHKLKQDTSKPKLKRRMATRNLPATQTQNAQTGSYIINTEGVMFQPEIEEDLYCEIGDINDVESDRY